MLIELLQNSQPFLLKRILYYAKLHDYVKYTSTLEEAWVSSISGISKALIHGIQNGKDIPEINVDQDFINEPITYFGRLEAQKHRQRGITLEMFLGLMKYYRQSYLDLITNSIENQEQRDFYALWVNRFFDQNEIAFCKEWNIKSSKTLMSELQNANRKLTNEKNKYLTIFESIPTPVMLFDAEHYRDNINYAAQQFLKNCLYSPGYVYYTDKHKQKAEDVIPCFIEEYMAFCAGNKNEATIEKICESSKQGKKNIVVKFHRMLDVSGKFTGTVIILTDQTEQKKVEEQLRYLSFYDMLTGLYNRSFFEQEIKRLPTGTGNTVGVVSCDIDGLKIVNDNLGHHAGDLLIKLAVSIIKSSFQESDVVCRIGGDEFQVLIPDTDEDMIQNACQKIRIKTERHNALNKKKPISISVGCATGRLFTNRDILDIIIAADSLMYAEKKTNHDKYYLTFQELFKEYGKELFS